MRMGTFGMSVGSDEHILSETREESIAWFTGYCLFLALMGGPWAFIITMARGLYSTHQTQSLTSLTNGKNLCIGRIAVAMMEGLDI